MEEEEDKRKKFAFLTTQQRTTYPHGLYTHKLGRKTNLIPGSPWLGPGAYDNEEINSINDNSKKWITSRRGYTHQSRTGPRLKKDIVEKTPCPTAYQKNWTAPKHFTPAYQPFNAKTPKLLVKMSDEQRTPGPGVYDVSEVKVGKKIQWPGQFGKPIHPIEPDLPQRSIRTELMVDKEYRKFKNKVAYFRLHY